MKIVAAVLSVIFSVTVFANCEQGKVITGYIRPFKELQMYTKPSTSSKKVINERASYPRTVNQDYELTALCETKTSGLKGQLLKLMVIM